MLGLLPFLSLILPLALIGLVVAAVMAIRRQAALDDESPDPGIGTPRRIFLYGLALVGLIFAAVGLSMLLGGALDALFGDIVIAERRRSLSVALSFTVVGTPAWLFFIWLAQRSLFDHPVERRSQARRLYFDVARGVALSVVAVNAVELLRTLLGVQDFDGSPWGMLVAWAAVWLLHERLATFEPPPTVLTNLIERFYLYFGALLGLWTLVGGAFAAIEAPLSAAYDRAFRAALLNAPDWTEGLRNGIAIALVGGAIWGWHWLRVLVRRDRLTALWRVYVLLFGALTGVVLTIGPAAGILHMVLQWFFGQPSSATAAAHFSSVPVAVSALILGGATWTYHRAVLVEAPAAQERKGPERLYRYLVATAGLVTAAIGVATLLALAADVLAGSSTDLLRVSGWWRNALVRGVTLVVVGVPLWGRYWWRAQRRAITGDVEERAALSRRVYLFNALCLAILALLISLTIALYDVFDAVLGGTVARDLLRDGRWSIAVALTTAAIAVYHFLVLREDQRALAAVPPAQRLVRRREVTLLAPGDVADAIVPTLEAVEGVRLRVWRRLDLPPGGAAPTAQQLARVRDQILAAEADRLVVLAGRAGIEVLPFARSERYASDTE